MSFIIPKSNNFVFVIARRNDEAIHINSLDCFGQALAMTLYGFSAFGYYIP
ncbi:MAG: hypothetical protein LBN74_06220 [Prevotella sp.]|nr:hypothetical protein [Prevotella sp.]